MNNTFTKNEVKTIEKFLNFAKEYFDEEAKRYVDNNTLLEAMVEKSVNADMMLIALKVCKEHQDDKGNVKINVL